MIKAFDVIEDFGAGDASQKLCAGMRGCVAFADFTDFVIRKTKYVYPVIIINLEGGSVMVQANMCLR